MNLPWGLQTAQTVSGAGPGSRATFTYGDTSGHQNMTQEQHLDSATATWLTTNYTYDSYGNVLSVIDPLTIPTTYTYHSDNVCPATKTLAFGTAVARTFTYTCADNVWDLIGTAVDDHSITNTYSYDIYGRTTGVVEAGGGISRTTATAYNDAARSVIVNADLNSNADGLLVSKTYRDQLERVSKTVNPAGSVVETSYYTPPGGGVSYVLMSNPFVTGSEPTMGWTLATQDTMGRATGVQRFSGSSLPTVAFGGGNMAGAGTATTSYSSNTTTVTDEASVQRVNSVDGLGRLSQVVESGISQTTSYCYDALDDLTGVYAAASVNCASPPTAARSFAYSSMKRLSSAANPETGTISYAYDANGNLATRVMGGITTTYCYDKLNELTAKVYSASGCPISAPAASYTYTGGWRTSATSSSSISSYSYDGLGRVSSSAQTTNGVPYSFPQYLWNLADGLKSETLPSGRVITNTYDTAGRLSQVAGASTVYGTGMQYAPQGALQQMTMGNGIVETTAFNSRLQPASVGAVLGTTSLLSLGYYYCYGMSAYCTYNNGNPLQQNIQRAGVNVAQTYGYDGANRMSAVGECDENNSCAFDWSQAYAYDARGNRAVTAEYPSSIVNPVWTATSVSQFTANNQFVRDTGPGGADKYDAAGNQISVASSATDPDMVADTMSYDAENRMVTADFAGLGNLYYAYDADGRRVTKSAPATTYVYDGMEQLEAEYSTGAGASSGTLYLTADTLGSTRLVTNSSGAVVTCYDYIPFGEDIANGVGPRGSCYPSGIYPAMPDVVSGKFTGKERDAESGLDYFGARYMSSAQGRFTSPDEPLYDQQASDPQSWNLYTYVRNNPLRFTDAFGQDCQDANNSDPCFTATAHASWFGRVFSAIGNFLGSAGTEATANAFIDTSNTIDSMRQKVYGGVPIQQARIEPTTAAGQYGQYAGMIVPFLIPGLGEADSLKVLTEVDRLSIVKPNVTNPKLAEIVEGLFQETDKVPAGTAGAVRYERLTGDLLSPAGHAQDARETITRLNKFLVNNPGISVNDQSVAKGLILDLDKALVGK